MEYLTAFRPVGYNRILRAGLVIACLCLAPGLLLGESENYIPAECPHETYTQKITITFSSESDARRASVQTLPLFNGYEWSFSSRWDDNSGAHLKTRDVLLKHGYRGTWYLNEPDGFEQTARKLVKDGFSIGSHSMTHPYLSFINRNRIFYELAATRALWEAAADTQIVSHAFSFCNFRNELEQDVVHADIDRALQRAGIYHLANHWYHDELQSDIILSGILPSDGDDIDPFAQKALSSERFHNKIPNLSHAMHSWYDNGDDSDQKWAKFESQLDKYGRNPDWWYCNQNQYAAYRYQFLHSLLSSPVQQGNTLTLMLIRPRLLDLNDATPISLQIQGVATDKIQSVECPTASVTVSDRKTGGSIFHLDHDRDQKLPEKTGAVVNEDNHQTMMKNDLDSDFPKIHALLAFDSDAGKINLTLNNQTDLPLSNVRITFRLPLAWKEGIKRVEMNQSLPAGAERVVSLTPTLWHNDYKYLAGMACFVAQIDFLQSSHPGRIHALCLVNRDDLKDPSYPQGRFLLLGPVRKELLDTPQWIDEMDSNPSMQSASWSSSWEFTDGSQLQWFMDPMDNIFHAPFLDVEITRARVITEEYKNVYSYWFSGSPLLYLLQSCVISESDQPVHFLCSEPHIQAIYLNGQRVEDFTGRLKKGDNTLRLIFNAQNDICNGSAPGCFLRLDNPQTGDRLTNIRYEPDKLAIDATKFYHPQPRAKDDRNFQAVKQNCCYRPPLP